MRRLIDEAARRVVAHIVSLPEQPAQSVEGAVEYARTLIEPLPERGTAYEPLLDHLFEDLIPRSFNAGGPGYLSYIPGSGIIHSAIADFIADAVNRYVGVFAAAPALAQIEANVVRWLCEIVGFGKGSGGVLTSGGSLANLIALVTARKELLPEDFLRGTLYCGDQVHHAFQKADGRFSVRVDALEEAIARDRAEGFTPFLVAGSAGTTNTGAVDDLEALGRLARANSMWFHVDGAYGALFRLTERGHTALRGIESADSVVLDPHKALFLPFGTGALVVRDARALRRAHSMHADYLPAFQQDEELVDFCELSPELSRDFRGLRVWLPIKVFGIDVFRQQLDEKLDLAQWAAGELRTIDGIEIVAEPQLSTVVFRLSGGDDAANQAFLARINAPKRVMLTGAVVDGRFVLRICVLSFRTHMDRMRMCIEDIRAAVAGLSAAAVST